MADSFMDTFCAYFCTSQKGLRIDREVLVVLAKAAGLTGTKLDPNGADLAAKLLGVGLCLFASALEFICSAIVMVSIPYSVRSQGAPNYMVGCCVGMYYGGELLDSPPHISSHQCCFPGQVLGNPLLIAISNRFGRRFAIILCLVSKSAIFAPTHVFFCAVWPSWRLCTAGLGWNSGPEAKHRCSANANAGTRNHRHFWQHSTTCSTVSPFVQ